MGLRSPAKNGRDQIVRILTRDHRTPVQIRSATDDRNLNLLLAFGLRGNANCLDVGAHKGVFLRQFRRIAPLGRHIAYEPLQHLYEGLVRDYPEMEIRQRALSDQAGQSAFVHVTDHQHEGYSGLDPRNYPPGEVHTETITVTTERLDDHLPDGWLPDFVKIDVEGAESLVIAGGIDTLRRARPTMSIEHGCGADDVELYKVITADIKLRLFDMDGAGPLDLAQFQDKLASGEHWNWIAHE
jgi:FkbM family methyltransferase